MAYSSADDDHAARGYEGTHLRGRSRDDSRPAGRLSYGATGIDRAYDPDDPLPGYDDRPTSNLPSFREREAQAAATAAEAERRGLMYRVARERMNNRGSTDIGLLVLRTASLLLLVHGIPKMMGFAGFVEVLRGLPATAHLATPAAYAVVAGELGLPVLLFFGLATRAAGALLAVQMALTYILVHLGHEPLLAATGGLNHEAAVLYAVLGLVLAFSGAGRVSLDHGILSDWRERQAERQADRMAEE